MLIGYKGDEPADYDVVGLPKKVSEAKKTDKDKAKKKAKDKKLKKEAYGNEPTRKIANFSPKNPDEEDTQIDRSAPEKAALKAQNQKKVDKQLRGVERQAQHMASQEPTKFKFTKHPSGDFALSRVDLDKEALAGPKDPSVKTPQSPQASAALHTRDKSQMQGVGPKPTMMDPKRDPFKPMGESAPDTDKAEDFVRKNKDSFKKRYGARWKEVLYATANAKFGNKKS